MKDLASYCSSEIRKGRELLAAGLLRAFRFRSETELELYLYALDHKKINYRLLETVYREDGSILVRIMQQYNSVDLIDYE